LTKSRSEKQSPIVRDLRKEAPAAPVPELKGVSQEDFDTLKAKVDGLEGLTRDVLTGIKDKLAPRIDAIESFCTQLPKDLKDSFASQSAGLKQYVDQKAAPGPAGPAGPQSGGGILGFLQDQVKQAGGIRNLLGGGGGGQSPLAMEIADLEKLLLERERAVVRNSLRQALSLPPLPVPEAVQAASGSVVLTHP
jgi:hypothetical protein